MITQFGTELLEQLKLNRRSDLDKQLRLCNELLEYACKENPGYLCPAYCFLADYNWFYGKFEEILKSLELALKYSDQTTLKEYVIRSQILMGSALCLQQKEECAFEHYTKALEESRKNFSGRFDATIYIDLGACFHGLAEYDRAIEYYSMAESALTMADKDNIDNLQITIDLDFAMSLHALGKNSEALPYITSAWERDNDINNGLMSFVIICVVCQILNSLNRRSEFAFYLEKLIYLAKISTDNADFFQDITELCKLFDEMGDYVFLGRALGCFKKYVQKEQEDCLTKRYLELAIKFYKDTNDIESYREMCGEYYELMSRFANNETAKRTQLLNNRFEMYQNELQRREMERQVRCDALTGLLNKSAGMEYIDEILTSDEKAVYLAMIDLDNFKRVNDLYGHLIGDEAIVAVAEIITGAISTEDAASRFGGDEFVLCLRNRELCQIEKIAEEINERISALADIYSGTKLACSIGIAKGKGKAAGGESTYEELLIKADKALYFKKNNGKCGYHIY